MSRNRNNAKYEFRQGKTRRKFAVKTESNNAPLKNALRTEKMGFFDRKILSEENPNYYVPVTRNDFAGTSNGASNLMQNEPNTFIPSQQHLRRSARLHSKENYHQLQQELQIRQPNADFSRRLLSQMKTYPDVQKPLLDQLRSEIKNVDFALSGNYNPSTKMSVSNGYSTQSSTHKNFFRMIPPSDWVYKTPEKDKGKSSKKEEKTQGFDLARGLTQAQLELGPSQQFDGSGFSDIFHEPTPTWQPTCIQPPMLHLPPFENAHTKWQKSIFKRPSTPAFLNSQSAGYSPQIDDPFESYYTYTPTQNFEFEPDETPMETEAFGFKIKESMLLIQ